MPGNESLADFLRACGASGPIEIELTDTRQGEVVRRVTDQPFLVLGKAPHVDLQLKDREVSRRHAYLQVVAGGVYCIDLLSRTALHWAQGPDRFGWLDLEEVLGIGPFRIRVLGGIQALPHGAVRNWKPLATLLPRGEPLPGVDLESVVTAGRSVLWRISRVLTLVGEADDCKLRIREETVSRFCCCLVHTAAGTWVVDLLGRPGTMVNGKLVRWCRLDDGDSLGIGTVSLRVRYQGAGSASEPGRGLVVRDAGPTSGIPATLPPAERALSPVSLTGMPAEASLGKDAASLLGLLNNSFGQMQQQMFGQLMQALTMMGQMFTQMQRDQFSLIQEALEKLHRVNQELQALRSELAQQELRGRRGEALQPVEKRLESGSDRAESAAGPHKLPARERNGHDTGKPSDAPAAEGGNAPQPAPGAKSAEKVGRTSGQSDQDVHARLSQRILALQQEGESLWQQILNRLTGK